MTQTQPAAPARPAKVSIIGAGSVGAAIAYAMMIRGVAPTIALHDLDERKVRAEVLDLNHGMQFTPMATIIGAADEEVVRDSDVIVLTAGAKQKPGQTRLELAGTNVDIFRKLVPRLVELAPETLLLVVTNPVDVITYATLKFSGLPQHRVFGSGTVLDSSRLRHLVSLRTRVAVQNVHAYIAGEHGDSEIPLWSSATIGGVPLTEWDVPGHNLDPATRDQIAHDVVHAAYEIIEGKGATSLAIGLAVTRILEAVVKDENRVLPVSSLLTDYAPGITDVCLSMPSVVNRRGVDHVLDTPLSEAERAGLRASAEAVVSVARGLGL